MKIDYTISIIGCGWLGLPLGKRLVDMGHIVKGSTTTAKKLAILHQHGIDPFLIEVHRKIKGNNLQHFFNSGILIINIPPGRKRKDVARSHPQQIAAIIERGLLNGVRKVLFISSTSIYGNVNRVVTEADEPNPETASGEALVKVEEMLLRQPDLETTIIRFGGLVGEDRPAGRFLAGKTDVANGDAPVNMIHRADCIGVLSQIIAQNHWGYLYNVCATEHPTRREFYTQQAKKQGFEPPIFSEEKALVGYKEVSNYKIREDFGYQFQYPNPMEF
ncbi:MAG: SDR family oxidoreductase [Bacteroidota bacterium]